MEPYLLEAYGFVLWADFPCCTVSSPTGSGEEPAERIVVCVHPPAGTGKSIGTQGVRAGVQEPRAMASMLRRRIHDEHFDRAVQALLGVVIWAGHRGRKAHHSRAVSRDKDTERSLRRSLNRRPP